MLKTWRYSKCHSINTETYLTINFGNIVFVDSYQIIPEKLCHHVANLPTTACKLSKVCDKLRWIILLLTHKGVYQYEYMDLIVRICEVLILLLGEVLKT